MAKHNPGHVHPGDRKPGSPADDTFRDFEDLEARNEAKGAGVEEPRDKPASRGGAHAGRRGARPGRD